MPDPDIPKIAMIGFGEAGQAFARGLGGPCAAHNLRAGDHAVAIAAEPWA